MYTTEVVVFEFFMINMSEIKIKPDVKITAEWKMKFVEAKSTPNHPIRVSDCYKIAAKLWLHELDGISDTFVFSLENKEPLIQIVTNTICPNTLIFASRDKSLIIWELNRDENSFRYAKPALKGHNGFVSDVVTSSDGQAVLWN